MFDQNKESKDCGISAGPRHVCEAWLVVHARMIAKSVAWLFLRGPPPNQGSFNSKDSMEG